MAMPKATFAQLLRSASARRKTRALGGPPAPQRSLHCAPAPDAAADPSSGAVDVRARIPGPPWPSPRSAASSFQRAAISLTALNGLLLTGVQAKLLKRATAALADALAGPSAPPSLRLRLRRGLRAAALVAYAASHTLQLCALILSLAHTGDAPPGLATEVELANGACSLVMVMLTAAAPWAASKPSCPPALLRAVAATSALADDWLDVGAAAEGLMQHPGLQDGLGKVLELMCAGLRLVEDCRGLLEGGQEAEAVSKEQTHGAGRLRQRQQQRDTGTGSGGGDGNDGGDGKR